MRSVCLASFLLAFTIFCNISANASVRIQVEPAKSDVFVNERVPLEIVLYYTEENISGIGELSALRLKDGSFATVSNLPSSKTVKSKKIKGTEYKAIPISRHLVSFDNNGTFSLTGAVYEVELVSPVEGRYDFWGRPLVSYERLRVEVPDCEIKVKKLPTPRGNNRYSGAIGDFTVKVDVPPGNIVAGSEAIAVITVEGQGFIPHDAIPEYGSAFKEGMKLKSVSDSRDNYMDAGQLKSRIRLECTFIPDSAGQAKIGTISFDYFDTDSGKYRSASSSETEIEVKSSTVNRMSIEV